MEIEMAQGTPNQWILFLVCTYAHIHTTVTLAHTTITIIILMISGQEFDHFLLIYYF